MPIRYDLSNAEYEAAFAAFLGAIAKLGGQGALANVCRCTQGNVSQLVTRRSLLPDRFVLKVEAATKIPRHDLRPDLYPAPNKLPLASAKISVVCDRSDISQRRGAA